MNKKKGNAGIIILIYVAIIVFVVGGWIGNLVKLCKCDFQAPYKTEIIRVVGLLVPPVGMVTGWMSIGEEVKK